MPFRRLRDESLSVMPAAGGRPNRLVEALARPAAPVNDRAYARGSKAAARSDAATRGEPYADDVETWGQASIRPNAEPSSDIERVP